MLERHQIEFKLKGKNIIGYDYNHEVMKNIYRWIGEVDKETEESLHDGGYRTSTGHIMKLFNFGVLFKNVEFSKESICLDEESKLILIISGKKEIVSKIIAGVKKTKDLVIGSTLFNIEKVNSIKSKIEDVMLYRAISPVVAKTKDANGKALYLNPYDENYYRNLVNNAKRKYALIYGKEFLGDIYFDMDNILKIRSKRIKFKEGHLIGYQYDVWVETTKEMQEIIYHLGLGQNSSTGMGCLTIKDKGVE